MSEAVRASPPALDVRDVRGGRDVRGARDALAQARRRTFQPHPSLRALRVLRSVSNVAVGQTPAPPLDEPHMGLDVTASRLMGRPAIALLGFSICVALGAHGALAVGSAGLRPKRVHKERVVMSVMAAPVDEVLPEPTPPPPPKPPVASAGRAPTALPARAASATAATLPAAPLLPGSGAGLGPLGSGGGGGPVAAAVASAAPAAEVPVTPPRPHPRTAPAYPHAARLKGLSGRVVLSVLVDEHGRVADVRVLESDPAGTFDAAAVAAARAWTFAPATRGGTPTSAWVRQAVRFSLD